MPKRSTSLLIGCTLLMGFALTVAPSCSRTKPAPRPVSIQESADGLKTVAGSRSDDIQIVEVGSSGECSGHEVVGHSRGGQPIYNRERLKSAGHGFAILRHRSQPLEESFSFSPYDRDHMAFRDTPENRSILDLAAGSATIVSYEVDNKAVLDFSSQCRQGIAKYPLLTKMTLQQNGQDKVYTFAD